MQVHKPRRVCQGRLDIRTITPEIGWLIVPVAIDIALEVSDQLINKTWILFGDWSKKGIIGTRIDTNNRLHSLSTSYLFKIFCA